MKIEISNADLIDKITILELKMENLSGTVSLKEFKKEYDLITPYEMKSSYRDELKNVNQGIWEFRDINRQLHSRGVYNNTFIANTKRIIDLNNERVKLKQKINTETNSTITNQRGYDTPIPTPTPSLGSLDEYVFFMDKH
tara:strand:- start:93 stop:512 length:420 start_codon:yes stop_codon:yes gene_type:complete